MKNTASEMLFVFQSLKPQSSSSASNDGSVVDTLGYDECLVISDMGTATGAASTTVSVRYSAASDGSASSALTGASFVAVTSANHNKVFVGRIDLAALIPDTQRYLFARAVGDGANAQVYAVTFVLFNYKYDPVSQTNAVAFSYVG
jgi:hypothetical protein